LRTIKIRIKDRHILDYLKNKIFLTQHFENMLIILINQDINQNNGKNFRFLTNGRVMRAIFTNTSGGVLRNDVEYVKTYYKDNSLMHDLINVSRELKSHNLVEQIKNIKKNYKSTYTQSQNGNFKANKPSTKKLSSVNHITLYMDGYKSITLKRKNVIGLNLYDKMIYTHVKHEPLLKIVKNFSNIKNINLNYSNGYVYMLINYIESQLNIESVDNIKYAGLDIGIKNIASIYIHDNTSKSLIISGKKFIAYNSSFNRLLSKIDNTINNIEDNNHLNTYKRFIFEKKNNYFHSEFHKLSKYILLYLKNNNVTHLVLSKSINELKNNGKCKISKNIRQHFFQIPIIKLIDYICLKASKFNIKIIQIDESYTSKTSCLSSNIFQIKSLALSNSTSTDVFGGRRVKRGLFKDYKYNKIINADLNAAFNICKYGSYESKGFESISIQYYKLCNPKKIYTIAI
jgi:transposase, IS605 orfB family